MSHKISLNLLGRLALSAVALFLFDSNAKAQTENIEHSTIKIVTAQREYTGRPIAWDDTQMALLRTNGRLTIVKRSDVIRMSKLADGFQPLTSAQIQAQLQEEFGKKYQVSITEHFVVVHPPGDFQQWAEPFERLYVQFRGYFWDRGFALESPEFPMVAVVLKSRKEFDLFLKEYVHLDSKIQGYYSPTSNRIVTYRQQSADRQDLDFFQLSTVIHEATHQVAYNTGIHSRSAQTQRWATEGLAMMFEARGIHHPGEFPNLKDRVNHEQLYLIRRFSQAGELRGKLKQLIESDELFVKEPLLAYSMAWGVSFYLAETQPAKYSTYLKSLKDLPGFSEYSSGDRCRDFEKHFGSDYNDIEIRMFNYLSEL